MHNYVNTLGLDFDPFDAADPEAADHGFFAGGGRQALLQQLVEQASHSGALLAVTGEPGAGKSTMAIQLARDLGRDAVCAVVPATLFMNEAAFLDQVHGALGLTRASDSDSREVLAFANDLALDARTLVLIIDDAQELASDVYNLLTAMLKRNPGGGLAVVLFGETQLLPLLQRSLPPGLVLGLKDFTLPTFSAEDSLDYVRFKLASAGFRKPVPLSRAALLDIHNQAEGLPGALHRRLVPALIAATTPDPALRQAPLPASLFSLGRRYWIAAGSLMLVLAGVLLLPAPERGAVDDAAGRQQIPLTVDTGDSDAVVPATTDSRPGPTAAANTAPRAAVSNPAQTAAASIPDARAATPAAVATVAPPVTAAASPESADSGSSDPATSSLTPSLTPNPSPAASQTLSGFEQRLLSYPAQSFAVQIMGSRSPDNIQRFLDSTPTLASGGYFTTTYQGQPWYVVVAGQFADRGSAEDAIARLPADVRELQPWVRSLADIQASIRSHYQLP